MIQVWGLGFSAVWVVCVQGVFLCTLEVCTLGVWVPKPRNMALRNGIWDPKPRGTNIKGTNLKSLSVRGRGLRDEDQTCQPQCLDGLGVVFCLVCGSGSSFDKWVGVSGMEGHRDFTRV